MQAAFYMEWKGMNEQQPLPEKLWRVYDFCERDNQFPLKV